MSTEISYKTYDGGEGSNCPINFIGYCKEEPAEVLKYVLFTHDVYHYGELYRPIDERFPNNVSGLCIAEFTGNVDLVTKSVKELDLSAARTGLNRTKGTILTSFERCKNWHTGGGEYCKLKYNKLLGEVEHVLNKRFLEENLVVSHAEMFPSAVGTEQG